MSPKWFTFLEEKDLAITASEATNITYWIGDAENAYENFEVCETYLRARLDKDLSFRMKLICASISLIQALILGHCQKG